MARRGNKEGSIVRRKDGRWQGAITVGWDGAKQRRRYFYGKTRAEVAAQIEAVLAEIHAGTYVEPTTTTLGEWLDLWLAEYVRPSLRPTTWTHYEGMVRLHLKPGLGNIPLARLQTAQVQRFLNAKAQRYSAKTVELMQIVLHAALKQAVVEGLIARNAADNVKRPQRKPPEMRVLSPSEMQRLLNVCDTERLGPVIVFMLGTGLRLGETLALRWADIQDGVVRVMRSASRVKSTGPTKTEVVVQEPKTARSRRTVPIPANVRTSLQQWRARQAEERLQMGTAWEDSGLVFTDYRGRMLNQSTLRTTLNRLCDRAGIKRINIHGLRHTYATRLLESGIHPRIAQELLGHSSIAMTLDIYSHVLPDQKRAAADAIDSFFDFNSCQIAVKEAK